jgi:hypothetical protein
VYAAIANVTITDQQAATSALHSQVVPQTKAAPGFVAGYWVEFEGGKRGTAMLVFESEEAARGVAQAPSPGEFITFDSIEVGEVVANA